MSRHRRDNLPAVLGSAPLQDLCLNTVPDLPVQIDERGICCRGDLPAGLVDQRSEVAHERGDVEVLVTYNPCGRLLQPRCYSLGSLLYPV